MRARTQTDGHACRVVTDCAVETVHVACAAVVRVVAEVNAEPVARGEVVRTFTAHWDMRRQGALVMRDMIRHGMHGMA